MTGWTIERSSSLSDERWVPWEKSFTFAAGTSLDGYATLKIWANGAGKKTNAAGNLIWADDSTWGHSDDVLNTLYNGSKQAMHQFRDVTRFERRESIYKTL